MKHNLKKLGASGLICITLLSATSGATTVFADLKVNDFNVESLISEDKISLGNRILNYLIFNEDTDSYSYDFDGAIANGLSFEQANNAKNMFENFSKEEVRQFEELRSVNNNGRSLTLAAILAALGSIGAAWLVGEILTLGAYKACQKWGNSSKAPKIFKNYCKDKGWA